MTSANVFHLGSVSQSQNLNANAATSKTKAGNSSVAAVFSSMMNVDYSTNSKVDADGMTQTSIKNDHTDRTQNSYAQYSYRDHNIASATMSDKLNAASDELNEFDKNVVAEIARDLGMDEDAVRLAMETLGLTAFGVLDPQNLALLSMELTGVSTPEDLLLQPQFVDLMQDMQKMQSELMKQLELMPEEMQKLLAQMETVENPQTMDTTDFAEVIQQLEQTKEEPVVKTDAAEEQMQEPLDGKNVVSETETAAQETAAQDADTDPNGQERSDTDGFPQQKNEVRAAGQTDAHVAERTPEMAFTTNQAMEEVVPQTEDASYLSIDTMDLIEQFAEKVKVTIAGETSSMEMQLNPENLGKVYLQISSEQGTVRAHIAASEEAVKNALETQVAELRETLEKSGVKVDSIEVTVASHEFERNLEQGQRREFEEGQRQQEQQSQRRNINLSSLDELSSLMTEEEALVAQIMKDNGNSVDLTA